MEATRTPKPWGYELLWARTDQYAGKILHVREGESLSLHYHRFKDETQYVLSGQVVLQVERAGRLEPVELGPGDTYRIPAGMKHRLSALERAVVLEVSTGELDDVVRLDDRYGRVPNEVPGAVPIAE